jgi:glycine dehydrogenase subunit 1
LSRYTAITAEDRAAMLAAIGVESERELFAAQIPPEVALAGGLSLGDLQEGRSEQEVYEHLRALAARNVSVEEEISFCGGGFYDHYVPAFIDMLCERSELLTPYTPYQPEVSQGSLQIMFEYQSAICELTAMEVANASLYDGPSALAAAAYMAKLSRPAGPILASAGLHPHARRTLATYAHGYGCPLVEVPLAEDGSGRTDLERWRRELGKAGAARPMIALFAQPNFYGVIEDAPALCEAPGGADAPLIGVSVDPLTLGVLAPPGDYGADIACGEGQQLGGRLDFGGPSFGFFAARGELLRRMPGRIAGQTTDSAGRTGYVLAFQTREQHIRRERATSNICTAQALNALAGLLYLVWLGPRGIRELGELLLARTSYARARLLEIEGVSELFSGPCFRELALRLPVDVAQARAHCLREAINPGLALAPLSGRQEDRAGLLVAITERRTRAQIDALAEALGRALGELSPVVRSASLLSGAPR